LFDTGRVEDGKHVLAYVLRDRGEITFNGSDFRPPPLHTPVWAASLPRSFFRTSRTVCPDWLRPTAQNL
jgi:hypothetical protein